jgi:hypothetical protein
MVRIPLLRSQLDVSKGLLGTLLFLTALGAMILVTKREVRKLANAQNSNFVIWQGLVLCFLTNVLKRPLHLSPKVRGKML